MSGLQYSRPDSIEQAVALLAGANGSGRVLAGGTDLLVQLRSGRLAAGLVVDVKRIAEMTTIREENGGFRIGAAVPGAELGEHPTLGKMWPGVVEAVNLIGSTQIQGRASAGGNLCNGSPAADSVPAMIAAAATLTIQGPDGRRELPVEQMITGPGRTALKPGELLVSFFLPKRPAHSSDAYLRLIPRTEMDIAVVGCGVSLSVDPQGVVTAARVALGAVAPTTLRVDAAAATQVGSELDEDALEKAAAACRAVCKPIDDKRGTIVYRTKIAGVLLKRAAAIAADRARGA